MNVPAAAPVTLARLRGQNNEGVLVLSIVVLALVIGTLNPDFWSVSTVFSILRNSMVELVLALGVLLVIVSGGIDVSFTAIAIFAAYTTVVMARDGNFDPGVLGAFGIAALLGVLLGGVNAGLIAGFRLPTLIVTLGTQGVFRGVLLAYVGSKYVAELPGGLNALSTADLLAVRQANGSMTRLHVFIAPVALLCLLVGLLLRRTMLGRGIYALGGDAESARRAGFPVVRLQLFIYTCVGLLAGLAGMMHVTLSRNANPYELVGTELDVIAAVVLGGASILGGRGSVTGTVLGVLLISLIKNSLVLMGVPGAWQRAVVGLLLLIGVTVQALGARRRAARPPLNQPAEVGA